jgi:hypothetical protein
VQPQRRRQEERHLPAGHRLVGALERRGELAAAGDPDAVISHVAVSRSSTTGELDDRRLPGPVQTALYRIMQKAVTEVELIRNKC